MAAGAIGAKLAFSLAVQNALGHDRARRIAGAQEQDIERIGLPAHGSLIDRRGSTLFGTAIGKRRCDQRRAEMRLAAAAILEQEGEQFARAVQIDGIDDRAAFLARADQPRAPERLRDVPTVCWAALATSSRYHPPRCRTVPRGRAGGTPSAYCPEQGQPRAPTAAVISICLEISNSRLPVNIGPWLLGKPRASGLKPASGKRTQPARRAPQGQFAAS